MGSRVIYSKLLRFLSSPSKISVRARASLVYGADKDGLKSPKAFAEWVRNRRSSFLRAIVAPVPMLFFDMAEVERIFGCDESFFAEDQVSSQSVPGCAGLKLDGWSTENCPDATLMSFLTVKDSVFWCSVSWQL